MYNKCILLKVRIGHPGETKNIKKECKINVSGYLLPDKIRSLNLYYAINLG